MYYNLYKRKSSVIRKEFRSDKFLAINKTAVTKPITYLENDLTYFAYLLHHNNRSHFSN